MANQTSKMVKSMIENTNDINPKLNDMVELATYNKVLCLKLSEKSKENIINVINSLSNRKDVLFAQPNYYYELCSVITPSDPGYINDNLYNAIDAYSHGVICDTCECTCRMSDYSCNNCDFCDNCDECHIYYTELHYWYYQIIQGNAYYHRAVCSYCGYQTTVEHEWVASEMAYVCTICNMTATSIPGIMQLPPDDELLVTSIDGDYRVGDAILPVREDDYVSE